MKMMTRIRTFAMASGLALLLVVTTACGVQGTYTQTELTAEQRAQVNEALPTVGESVPGQQAGHPLVAPQPDPASSHGMTPAHPDVLIQSEVSQIGFTFPYNAQVPDDVEQQASVTDE